MAKTFFRSWCGAVYVLVAAVVLYAGPIMADSSEEWTQIVEAGKKEGEVFVYGPPGKQRRIALVEEFQKAYPEIQVKFVA